MSNIKIENLKRRDKYMQMHCFYMYGEHNADK